METACNAPMAVEWITSSIADGSTPEQAWTGMRSSLVGGSFLTLFSRMTVDLQKAEKTGPAPKGMIDHVPTLYELAVQADEKYPGCSTGEYSAPWKH